jgi:hypothetical protein
MDADFSIELGREDPVLDFPWKDPAGKLAYVDMKRCPELIGSIAEALNYPELEAFLRAANSPASLLETAKCDAWATTELTAEEEIYTASHKVACYVDVVFSGSARRLSLPDHELFARNLVELLGQAPEFLAAAEICVRRCYFEERGGARDGFYFTLYVSGYGNDGVSARRNWGVALTLMANAIVQLSAARRMD